MSTTIKILWAIALALTLLGCGGSSMSDEEIRLEEAYMEGYYDALECVERRSGTAKAAAEYCD